MDDTQKSKEELVLELAELRRQKSIVEKELVNSSAKLKLMETILDQIPAIVYVKDLDSRHIYVNKKDLDWKYTCSKGHQLKKPLSRQDVMNKTDQEFYQSGLANELMTDENHIIKTGQPLLDKEEMFEDRAGNIRWLLTSKHPWRDETGNTKGVIGIGQEITWHKQEQDILNDINQRLFEVASVKEIMEQIAAGAMRLSNTTSSIIFMVENLDGNYHITEKYRFPANSHHPDSRIESGTGITREVILTGRPIDIPDTSKDPRVHPILLKDGVRALLAVPMIQDNQVIGVFYVKDTSARQFTSNEISRLSTLADYAIVALEKARLIQEKDEVIREKDQAQRQITALHQASGALIASGDPDAVLKAMAHNASKATGADWVNIVLIDEHKAVRQLTNYPQKFDFHVEDIRKTGNSVRIFETGKILIIRDVELEPDSIHPIAIREHYRSVIGLPLSVENNRRIGVIWLCYREKQLFLPPQVHALELFARQGAIAYNNALHLNKIEQMGKNTRAVTHAILQGNKRKTLHTIVSALQTVTRCDALCLYVYDFNRKELEHPPTFVGVKDRRKASRFGQVTRDSIVYQMMERDSLYIVPDVNADPRFADRPFVSREGIRSSIAVPLIYLGQKVGVIFVNYHELHDFKADELEAIQTFADQAAVAIPITQFLNDQQAHLAAFETLSQVSGEISSVPDIAEILKKIVQHARKLTGAAGSEIYLADYPGQNFTVDEERGRTSPGSPSGPHLNAPYSVISLMIQKNEKMVIDDPDSIRAIDPGLVKSGVKSMIILPLSVKSMVIGILIVYYKKQHHFLEDDLNILITLASNAAIAIHNEDQRIEQIDVMHRIARTIVVENNQVPTLQGILTSVLSLMPDLVVANIWLLDKNTNQLTVEARIGASGDCPDWKEVLPLGSGVVGWAAEHSHYRSVPDVLQDDNYWPYSTVTRSELAVPMMDGKEAIGVLNIERPRTGGFTSSDIQLVMAIAELAVVAIRNVHLYQRIQNHRKIQIKAVGQMAQSIAASSKSLQETLRNILEWIAGLIDESGDPPCLVEVFLHDIQTHNLVQLESWTSHEIGFKQPTVIEFPQEYESAILQMPAIYIHDVQADLPVPPRHPATRSRLVVPMLKNKQLHGILNIEHPCVDALKPYIELATAMAHIVLIAIDTASYIEQIKKAKRIAGGRTALAWMSLASGTWYHEVRGEANTIRAAIKNAVEEIDAVSEDIEPQLLGRMNAKINKVDASAKRIEDKKLILSDELSMDVTPVQIRRALDHTFSRIMADKAGHSVLFNTPDLSIEDNLIVMANTGMLERALEILINNGIQASTGPDIPRIDLWADNLDSYVLIAVKDNGEGLPKEIEEALNTEVPPPYDPHKKGLGMGLLFAQAIVEEFGGLLRAIDTGPKGTTMAILLPIEQR
jgi:GAF domain-containing protein